METVPKFMRQGYHLVERSIEIRHNAAFLHSIHAHAKRSTALSRALLCVDPVLFKRAPGEFSQFRRESAEKLQD